MQRTKERIEIHIDQDSRHVQKNIFFLLLLLFRFVNIVFRYARYRFSYMCNDMWFPIYNIDLRDCVLQLSRTILFNQRTIMRNLMIALFDSGMRNRAHILFINRFESLLPSSCCTARKFILVTAVSRLVVHMRAWYAYNDSAISQGTFMGFW